MRLPTSRACDPFDHEAAQQPHPQLHHAGSVEVDARVVVLATPCRGRRGRLGHHRRVEDTGAMSGRASTIRARQMTR